MMGQQMLFWKRPMRVMDLALEDSHGSWVRRWTPERIVETAVRINANVLNLMVVNEWGQAYWPSPHLPMQPELDGEDRVGPVVKLARQAGLHCSAMWGPTAAPCLAERHPDWAARTREGKKHGWGFRGDQKWYMLCMNSPYEDLVNEVVDQLLGDYDIKLLALDYYYQEPCWCEYCRQRCLTDTKFDIFSDRPPYGREDAHRRWQNQRVEAQVLRLSEMVERHGAALAHYKVVPGTHVIFNEPHTGDMLDLRDKGLMIRRDTAEAQATGRASVICTPYGHHYYIGWSKPPVHMRQEFRVIGAHGSSPWAVMWDWEILRDPRGLEPLGTVFDELKSTADLMERARPLPHVALLFTRRTPAGDGEHVIEEHGDALKGFYDALTRAHVPFEVVCDDMITDEGLREHSTLVLPNVTCLSDAQIDTIRRFVSKGGHLIATFDASRYTTEGWSRYEFGLSDVFGVRHLAEFETDWCYLTPRESHSILAHLDSEMGVPHGDIWRLRREMAEQEAGLSSLDAIRAGRAARTGRHLKVEAAPGTQVIANVCDARKPRGTYFIKDIVPPIPGKDTGYPAIVINRFGRGSCVYFAGQPDRLFQRQGHPDYEEMLVRSVEWLSDKPAVRVEAPNTIEATYWRVDDRSYLIHLINHTHDAIFPAPATGEKMPASREVFRAIRHVVPVHEVKIHLEAEPVSVETLVGSSQMSVDGMVVALDRLDEYAVLRVELPPC